MPTSEQPPNSSEDRSRPVATDSGNEQGSRDQGSAGQESATPVSSPSSSEDINREAIQQRVLETEAWVARLKAARAEGTRISQENARGNAYSAPSQNAPRSNEGPRQRDDVDHLLEVLNKGDDRTFVSSVLDTAEKRTLNRFAAENQNRELAQRITQIVDEHAPDVPMDLFWSYTEDAIRIAPNDVSAQIEAAIRLSRRTLAQRDEKLKTRRDANATNRRGADTLDGSRDRPRSMGDADDEKRTMVDDVKAFQQSRR